MIAFIEDTGMTFGSSRSANTCRLPTFYDHMAKRENPELLSDQAKRDKALRPEVERDWEQNYEVYGVCKVWHQMRREGFDVARCTVARLMRDLGLEGVIRGKKRKTTISNKSHPCPLDKVNRQFKASAPNVLWVSDFTYVATWQSFVYVAFVIDAFARRIVEWRVSRIAHAGFVLDALKQAVHQRQPGSGLIHHSDCRIGISVHSLHLFSKAAFRRSFCMLTSAYMRFGRRFSSAIAFISEIRLAFIPPYFARQL